MVHTCLPQFAAHHDIPHFYEVSAKTGANVTEAFEAFFREVHRKVSDRTTCSYSITEAIGGEIAEKVKLQLLKQ